MAREDGIPAGTELARLIAAEERFARKLEAAEEEARRIVESAREEADEEDDRFRGTVEAGLVALEEEMEAQRKSTLSEIEGGADECVRRFEEVAAEQIESLADYVVARVIGIDTGAAD